MKKLNRLLSKIFAFFYLFIKISKIKWIKNYRSSSESIIWIKTNPIFTLFKYLKNNDLLSDFSLIESIVQHDLKFKIVFGKNIGKFKNRRIYYSVSENCNPYNLANYSATLFHTVYELEQQGNSLFPNSNEIKYWENKAYMQNQFKELNIPHPETLIINRNYSKQDLLKIEFPVLIKEIHSAGSRGITRINNETQLHNTLKIVFDKGHSNTLVQKLVNMRKDLRVVVLGNKITSFYWRVNSTDDWKPTATSFGNSTEFDNFPDQWKELILSFLPKMKLLTGAFDITWENDDLNTTPLVLEVSPSYQINPTLPERYKKISYKDYKKKIFVKDAYYKQYVDAVFALKYEIILNHLILNKIGDLK